MPRHRTKALRCVIAAAAGALFSAAPALAQSYDCDASPQQSCGKLLSVHCLEIASAGSEKLDLSASACSAQLEDYKGCLSWIAEHCPAPRAQHGEDAADGAAGGQGGQTIINTGTTTLRPEGDYIAGDKVDTKIDQVNIYEKGVTPENPTNVLREHCFTFDGKRMCERY